MATFTLEAFLAWDVAGIALVLLLARRHKRLTAAFL
jgi:hypothetical protein